MQEVKEVQGTPGSRHSSLNHMAFFPFDIFLFRAFPEHQELTFHERKNFIGCVDLSGVKESVGYSEYLLMQRTFYI